MSAFVTCCCHWIRSLPLRSSLLAGRHLQAPRSSIEHQRSVTYLRLVCLQPDPADGSLDYFACSGGGHWAKHSSEPSSDDFEAQESFFTRMGNPHPLQMQHFGQPTTPQLNPIMTQPVSAPTALAQQIPMPILPLAHPMADPATTGLHIPTLQAIHRTAPQQPPSRFRPSNYTVDLSNTTNPPPPQVMVKPAVMQCRAQSQRHSGSGIPEATYSELAAILLNSGRSSNRYLLRNHGHF